MSDKLHKMRHTTAHVLAAAVQKLYPTAKFGVGPAIDNGFYYDILLDNPLSDIDLKKIQKEMHRIINKKYEMVREDMGLDEAIGLFTGLKQGFKVELLNDLKTKGTTKFGENESGDIDVNNPEIATIYKTGEFTDLCRGPHLKNTSEIGAFKLSKIAGAYWRGDNQNPQMQRIYGLCFETDEELRAYELILVEAKKRDHRKLGQELDLFTFSDLVGPGLPMFTPRGTVMREQLTNFVWELMKPYGYDRVTIPHMAKSDLYKTSGHWEKFADDIFKITSDKTDTVFVMKPMNCPHHTQIYASKMRSYRDLPIRYSEVTAVYRDENTGQLQGLSRVRSITQDDAHVFCTMEQVKDEARGLYDIITKFYKAFDMPLKINLSVHDPDQPDKYLGGPEVWEKAESILAELLNDLKCEFKRDVGEAAFYGPKIDFIAIDAIGREWQLATVQLDFNLPERFELEYVDEKNERQRPVMLHRAILGSVERFMGIMIEHYAGVFPLWLAPEQIRIVPVSEDFIEFANQLRKKLDNNKIRSKVDNSNETVGKKIRASAKMKIPWTIVVGEKEVAGGDYQINVFGQEEDIVISQDKFISKVIEATSMPEYPEVA